MPVFAPGIWQGINASMQDQRAITNEQQIQAARKQLMDMNALEIERARAADAQKIQQAQSFGSTMNEKYPMGAPPQTPEPGQASVPMGPPQPMQQSPQAAGPPPIPPYQAMPHSSGIAPPVSASGNWNEVNASNKATQPARNEEQLRLLVQEYGQETDPANKAALKREIDRAQGKVSLRPPAPPAAPQAPGGPSAPPPMGQPQQTQAPPGGQQPQARDMIKEHVAAMRQAGVPQDQWMGQLDKMKDQFGLEYKMEVLGLKAQNEAMREATALYKQKMDDSKLELAKLREGRIGTHQGNQDETAKAKLAASSAKPNLGDMGKSGEDYLKTIPEEFRRAVKAVAEGREKLSDAGYRGKDRMALMQMVNQYNPEYNVPKNMANNAALTQNTKDLAAIRPYKEMLDLNADVAIELGKKVISTNSALANKTLNWVKQNMADNPDTAEYLAQMSFVQTEAARVLANPRLVGQLTDSARHEMQQVISGNMPIESTERVLKRIKQDGDNRVNAMIKEHDSLLSGSGGGTKASAAPTSGGPKPGTIEDGHRFKGGNAWDKSNWEKV